MSTNPHKYIRRSLERGSSLIYALVLVVTLTALGGAAMKMSLRATTKAKFDGDYARALDVAEAGMNAEIVWVNTASNGVARNTPHTPQSPLTGSVSTIGTYSVYAANPDGTTPYVRGNDMLIVSTGTSNGIQRRVQMLATFRGGIFGTYALFGSNRIVFSGGVTQVWGDMGANYTIQGSGTGSDFLTYDGHPYLSPEGTLLGSFATPKTIRTAPLYILPTVDEVCLATYGGASVAAAWDRLRTLNSGFSRMRVLNQNITNYNLLNNTNTRAVDFVTPAAGALLTTRVPLTNTNVDRVAPAYTGDPDYPGAQVRTIILPPGDYLFHSVNLTPTTSGQTTTRYRILLDPEGYSLRAPGAQGQKGKINIWIFDTSGGNDVLSAAMDVTGPPVVTINGTSYKDPSQVRIYYNTQTGSGLTVNTQGKRFYGGLYSVLPVTRVNFAIRFIDTEIYGTVLSNTTEFSRCLVRYPTAKVLLTETDFGARWTLTDNYMQIPIRAGGANFRDGTTY